MKLLYGKPIANEILKRLGDALFKYEEKPGLAVILVGEDAASKIYVDLKEKRAKDVGIEFYKYLFSKNDKQEDIITLIELLNNDPEINGIIVQLPLPADFETEKILSAINPAKDVDGFSAKSSFSPVFSSAIMKLLESSSEDFNNKKALIIANSKEFGEGMVLVLQKNKIKADWIFSKKINEHLEEIKKADIVVSASGLVNLLSGGMFKEGAIVIDGGISKIDKRVVGDVDLDSVKDLNGYITPVPGGVGPVTIACLLENVYLAFKSQKEK